MDVESHGKLLLAVDGGQTGTRAALADADGRVAGYGRSGPVDRLVSEEGRKRSARSLLEAVRQAFDGAGLPVSAGVEAGFLGMSGIENDRDPGGGYYRTVLQDFGARWRLPAERLVVDSDAVSALSGALVRSDGVVVIAGTGSVALGIDARGTRYRAGGYGYLFGDEGSGFWVGQTAVSEVLRSLDGRAGDTALTADVAEALGVDDPAEIADRLYGSERMRPEVAGLAEVVHRAALQGDRAARRILASAGRDLAALARAVLTQMGDDRAPVGLAGNLFRAGHFVTTPFRRALSRAFPTVEIRRASHSPLLGAAYRAYALLMGDGPTPEWMKQVEGSLRRFEP